MKRNESVIECIRCLFIDIGNTYPGKRRSLSRDFIRYRQNCDRLSHFYFSIELPRVADALHLALAVGSVLPLQGVNHLTRAKGKLIPRFLESLWEEVFDPNDGLLRDQPDSNAILFIRQICLMFKKLEGSCEESTVAKAKEEFFAQEESIRRPSLRWNDGPFETNCDLDFDLDHNFDSSDCPTLFELRENQASRDLLRILQSTCDVFAASIEGFNPFDWKGRHGPGAVSDRRVGEDKYSFPVWPSRLDAVFPYDAYATSSPDFIPDYIDHEHPAKLIAVPKDARGPRLIASEPTYLQWCQQALNTYLRAAIKDSCIKDACILHTQIPNQEASRRASVSNDCSTVDLKSASDLLSLWTIERVFRKNPPLLYALQACRSRFIQDGKTFSMLHKLAPMGAAFTFPIQSIVYTLFSAAAVLFDTNRYPSLREIRYALSKVQVFGDDIIIPTTALGHLESLLRHNGLVVNTRKSFSQGNFRESCGTDWYNGEEVTPAYIKCFPSDGSPESLISGVEIANNLWKKGLFNLSDRYTSMLPKWLISKLPGIHLDSGAFGLRSFVGLTLSHLQQRWNKSLHRTEYRMMQPKVTQTHITIEGERNLLQYFSEDPDPYCLWKSGVKLRRRVKFALRWVPSDNLIT